MISERTWFRCVDCKASCDLSMLAAGFEDKPAKICKVCEASYCPGCDCLLLAGKYELACAVFCNECGFQGFVSREVYENIKQLNGEGS